MENTENNMSKELFEKKQDEVNTNLDLQYQERMYRIRKEIEYLESRREDQEERRVYSATPMKGRTVNYAHTWNDYSDDPRRAERE